MKISAADLAGAVKFDGVGVIPISRKMFFDLNEASAANKSVHITYWAASKDEVTERLVDPYLLVENRDIWYLVAWCHLRKDKRIFALHRIKDYCVSEQTFEDSANGNIDEWMQLKFLLEEKDGLQQVNIHFGKLSSRYIRERIWHKQQKLSEHEDGTCSLEFPTLSLDETKRWVLQYGADAEVIAPPALRDMVAAELKQAAERYS